MEKGFQPTYINFGASTDVGGYVRQAAQAAAQTWVDQHSVDAANEAAILDWAYTRAGTMLQKLSRGKPATPLTKQPILNQAFFMFHEAPPVPTEVIPVVEQAVVQEFHKQLINVAQWLQELNALTISLGFADIND